MIILVDFENTHASGFQGVEYLDENDTLVVYYSDENSAVSKGVVDDLKAKNVHVRMVKLLKQHSNALDMYIASTTGMFLDTGDKICIVSKDKGYAAVRDFWHSLRGAEILLGETIEECFLHSVANDDSRIRRAKERSQKVLLTEAFETMNNIPTRPTLSRNNFWKRRKQANYDLSKNLSPVEILPNPLAKPETETDLSEEGREAEELQSLVEEEQLSALHDIVLAINAGDATPQADSGSEIAISFEDASDRGKIEENAEDALEDSKASAEAKEKEENTTSIQKENPNKSFLQKKAQNQIQFMWDPITKSMIRVGEETKENSVEERESSDTKSEIITEGTTKKQRRRRSGKNHAGVKEKANVDKLCVEGEKKQDKESGITENNSSKETQRKESKIKEAKAKKLKTEETETKAERGKKRSKKENSQKEQAEVNTTSDVEKKAETDKASEEKTEKKKNVRRRSSGAKKKHVEDAK